MTDQPRQIHAARRGFFRSIAGLGVLAGAGALVLRAGKAPRAEAAAPAAEAQSDAGYRETDHVRRYYDTARG